jgi:hypothetical protein
VTAVTRTEIPHHIAGMFQEIQCGCDHGAEGQCVNTAAVTALIHCVDRCNQPAYQPHGNTTEFLCIPCLNTLVWCISHMIVGMLLRGHPNECTTCHQPCRYPPDVIREIRPIQ